MSSLIEYAKQEFADLGWDKSTDEMQKMACDNILELLTVLSEQGHSGHSVNYVLNAFNKLARFHPITQIKDEPQYWSEGDKGGQHSKDSSLFKKDGVVTWYNGVVFVMPSGSTWASSDSSVTVTLPCYHDQLVTHRILVDEDDRCVSQEEYDKYLSLVPTIARPAIERRKPKGL